MPDHHQPQHTCHQPKLSVSHYSTRRGRIATEKTIERSKHKAGYSRISISELETMRRKVKFQGILHGEDIGGGGGRAGHHHSTEAQSEGHSSLGFDSLIDRSWSNSKGSQPSNSGIFSNSNGSDGTPSSGSKGGGSSSTTESTTSSIGYGRRLYGRSRERHALKTAYQGLWEAGDANKAGSVAESSDVPKPTVQVALISGVAGTGKTALAMSLRQVVLEDGGLFLSGKFDRMQSMQLYGPFVTAFTQLVDTVEARGKEAVRSMRRAIQAAVHMEQRMLTDIIPALERILGAPKNDAPKEFRQSSDELGAFKYVFRMFVRAISSLELPIVIFLDDLHFADESSLDLLQSLVTDSANNGILFVSAFRVDKSNGQIQRFLKGIGSMDITDIRLAGLPQPSVDEMVADIFSVVHPRQIKPLTKLIHKQTGGNIFYIREFLRYLQEEKLLTFDEAGMEWVWDERKIINKVNFRQPVELVTFRLSKLPKATREVLEVSACLGSKVDERLLNRISPRPVFSHLQRATTKGFLQYDKLSGTYCFSHDLVQESAYKMIAYQERAGFHLTIGRELWKSFNEIEDLEMHIFAILGQIREGANLISYQEERNDVAALCLRAGELAISSSSFQTASQYLLLGVSMLGTDSWKAEYELSLELCNAAAEVEYCIANFDNVERLSSQIFANARRFPDTLRAHSIHVYSLGSRGHMLKAIERGLKVLQSLGEKFPTNQSVNSAAVAMKRTKWLVRNKSNDQLLRLSLMDDPVKLAAMKMMNVMFLYAYMAVPTLAPMISLRMVKLTLEYGLCDVSSVGFVTYGMLLCGSGNNCEEGCRFGELGMRVFEKFETKAWLGRIFAWYYGTVVVWEKPVATIFGPIEKAHRIALETGDVDFAMLNANIYCWECFDISTLAKVEKIVEGFSNRMEAYGQESVLMMIKPLLQMVHNLTGRAYGDPKILTGEVMDQDYTVQYARENNKMLLIWSHFYRLLLSYLFGDLEAAQAHATICRVAESNPFGSSDRVLLIFYDGLVALAQPGKLTRARQKAAVRCIKHFKIWSKQCPENFLGKQYFLEAELAAAMGDHKRAHSKYTSAISLSREGGYILQHALVNERAGKYHLQRGEKDLAHGYLKEALSLYTKWGGTTKVEHMRKEMLELF